MQSGPEVFVARTTNQEGPDRAIPMLDFFSRQSCQRENHISHLRMMESGAWVVNGNARPADGLGVRRIQVTAGDAHVSRH